MKKFIIIICIFIISSVGAGLITISYKKQFERERIEKLRIEEQRKLAIQEEKRKNDFMYECENMCGTVLIFGFRAIEVCECAYYTIKSNPDINYSYYDLITKCGWMYMPY